MLWHPATPPGLLYCAWPEQPEHVFHSQNCRKSTRKLLLDCNKFPGLTVNQGQQQHDFPLVDECKRSSICVTAEQDLQLVPSLKSRCSATSSEAKWLGAEEMAADGRKKLGFFFLVRGSDG